MLHICAILLWFWTVYLYFLLIQPMRECERRGDLVRHLPFIPLPRCVCPENKGIEPALVVNLFCFVWGPRC